MIESKEFLALLRKLKNKVTTMSKSKTIEITKELARELYPKSSPEWKAVLDQNFDKKDLIGEVTDRIKTPEDAIAEYVSLYGPLPDIWDKIISCQTIESRILATKAGLLLDIIEVVLNEGWEADYSNRNEAKWFVYFEFGGSAFAFLYSHANYDGTRSYVGSRRSFKSEKLAQYFGSQFIDLHNLALLKK